MVCVATQDVFQTHPARLTRFVCRVKMSVSVEDRNDEKQTKPSNNFTYVELS